MDKGAPNEIPANNLETLRHGSHVVIYSPDPNGGPVDRARLTWQHRQTFDLASADRHGRWGATSETATVETHMTILMERFRFILADRP